MLNELAKPKRGLVTARAVSNAKLADMVQSILQQIIRQALQAERNNQCEYELN